MLQGTNVCAFFNSQKLSLHSNAFFIDCHVNNDWVKIDRTHLSRKLLFADNKIPQKLFTCLNHNRTKIFELFLIYFLIFRVKIAFLNTK